MELGHANAMTELHGDSREELRSCDAAECTGVFAAPLWETARFGQTTTMQRIHQTVLARLSLLASGSIWLSAWASGRVGYAAVRTAPPFLKASTWRWFRVSLISGGL